MIFGDVRIIREILKRGRLLHGKPEMVNPASVNLCLGNTFLTPCKMAGGIKLGDRLLYDCHGRQDGEWFTLHPGEFCLATTKEKIVMPRNVAAFVQGRSSIGRIGLAVQNAGFVDPGFFGHITLELKNDSPNPIILLPGYPVAQLVFFDCGRVKYPYHGKYNGQAEATGSRMEMDRQKYPDLFI